MTTLMKRALMVALAALVAFGSMFASTPVADAAGGTGDDDRPTMDVPHAQHFAWMNGVGLLDPAVKRAHEKAHKKGGEYQRVFDDTYIACMKEAGDIEGATQRDCMRQARRAARQATGFTEDGFLPDGVPGGNPIVQPVIP